jgi:quinol monooxygenase YgiN
MNRFVAAAISGWMLAGVFGMTDGVAQPASPAAPLQSRPAVQAAGIAGQASTSPATAGQAAVSGDVPIIVVAHLDIIRSSLDRALAQMHDYVADARREPGVRQIDLLVQVGVPNHFTLVETWASQAAYDAHVAASPARGFRQRIDPFLASPYDDRLHTEVAVAP